MPEMNIYWGNRLEKMADQMFDALYGENGWANPMTPRCIVTNSPVMKAWLRHYFVFEWKRRQDRVLANCDFQLLYPFVNDWMDRLLSGKKCGSKRTPLNHPYSATNLQWRIYRLLSEGFLTEKPTFAPVNAYIGTGKSQRRIFKLAGKLATTFDDYQMYRYDVIAKWSNEKDSDNWQAALWQMLIEDAPESYATLFSKMDKASKTELAAAFDGSYNQIAVFGTTSMPLPYIHFLNKVMTKIVPVDCFVLNPGQGYWLEDVNRHSLEKAQERIFLKSPELIDNPLALPEKGHELLCSLGGALQNYLFTLHDECNSFNDELFEEPSGSSLLQQLQREIYNAQDSRSVSAEGLAYSAGDDSIQIQICHNARREVEVLHDFLLKELSDSQKDGTRLQPYQIQVLVADMPTYIPHIEAVFNSGTKHSQKSVPYAVDVHSSTADGELLSAFLSICRIVESRFQVSEIFDLLSTEAVLMAFDLSPTDLDVLEQIIKAGNMRWGLNEQHRQSELGIKMLPYMTWEYGLDRLLMGYATGTNDWHDDLFTTDYAEGANAVILGKLARFIVTLKHYVDIFKKKSRTLGEWHKLFASLLDAFFIADENSYREISSIRKAINQLRAIPENCNMHDTVVPYEVVVTHLEKELSTTTTGDSLLANAVVFCQLRPMNSRPAEITCVLGLNDGVFPRNDNRPTFDLLCNSRRRGDRSLRLDDRCAFLEALVNVRRKFYLSYTGRTDDSNEPVPPSIVLQELKDHLKRSCQFHPATLIDGSEGLPIETLHHLTAIHPDYFDDSAHPELFSFSKPDFLAAKEIAANSNNLISRMNISKKHASAQLTATNTEDGLRTIELDILKAFFVNPAKHYYCNTSGIRLEIKPSILPDDDEPETNDPLESYKLKATIIKELINNGLDSLSLEKLSREAKVNGCIPLVDTEKHSLLKTSEDISAWLEKMVSVEEQECDNLINILRSNTAIAADLELALPGKTQTILRGSYTLHHPERCEHAVQVFARPASLKTKDKIEAWISHLFACAMQKTGKVHTLAIGMDKAKQKQVCFSPLDRSRATSLLKDLLEIYYRGEQSPLPFAPETSEAYFSSLLRNAAVEHPATDQVNEAMQAAARKWGTRKATQQYRQEALDDYMFHVFGENGPQADSTADSEFHKIAIAFFKPMEENTTRKD